MGHLTLTEACNKNNYPQILQTISAVLNRPVLLQRWANSSVYGFFLLIQVIDHLVQTSHYLAALLLLLV